MFDTPLMHLILIEFVMGILCLKNGFLTHTLTLHRNATHLCFAQWSIQEGDVFIPKKKEKRKKKSVFDRWWI